ADVPHRGLARGLEVDSLELQAAGRDAPGMRHQAEDGAAGHRFPGARLAHDAELLAPDLEAHAPDGLHRVDAPWEPDPEILDGENRRHPKLIRSSGRGRRGARPRAGCIRGSPRGWRCPGPSPPTTGRGGTAVLRRSWRPTPRWVAGRRDPGSRARRRSG